MTIEPPASASGGCAVRLRVSGSTGSRIYDGTTEAMAVVMETVLADGLSRRLYFDSEMVYSDVLSFRKARMSNEG